MEVKTILILLVLNIALPTLDTFTDINLVIKLNGGPPYCDDDYYRSAREVYWKCKENPASYCSNEDNNQNVCRYGHPKMATAMLSPFLLNYIVCFITFIRKEKNKIYTFIFPLLDIYPQFEAARIIYLLVKNPSEGKKKKKIFDQDVGLLETCLESVPSVFIITAIWVSAEWGHRGLANIIFNPHTTIFPHSLISNGQGPGVAEIEFHTTYAISIISSALGLTKILKNGVARPIAPGGPLDGLLSGKFVLAFLANTLGLVARGVCIGFTIEAPGPPKGSPSDLAVTIPLLFLPQFLLSLFSTVNILNKSSLKILYRHPSLIILPTVTFFTFSRLNIGCGSKDSRVSFSKKFTYINIVLSFLGYVSWLVWWYFSFITHHPPCPSTHHLIFYEYILPITLPPLLISILLTILFLHLDKLPKCCCDPREQLSVYDPDQNRRFIMRDGEVVEDKEDDVEDPDDDVEAGTETCCGWCGQTEEPQTEYVAVLTVCDEVQQSLFSAGEISSSKNTAKVSDEKAEENVAGEDRPENLQKAAASALVDSDREEKYPGTEIEMVNIPVTIRKSEDEALKIVEDLIDDLIIEISL